MALFLGAFICLSAPVDAAKGKKRERATGGRMLNRFDRNGDGKIEGQEAERLRAVFAGLAALDTDRDGKLSDSEVAAAKIRPGKRKQKTP